MKISRNLLNLKRLTLDFNMKKLLYCSVFAALTIASVACKKDEPVPESANLIVKLNFDSTLARLDNFGQPATIPSENSAQSPIFHSMSAHYIELAPTAYTALGDGEIIYKGQETMVGGDNAVDFSNAKIVGDNDVFMTIPLSDVAPGTYQWVRVSLTYQDYDIKFAQSGNTYWGRLASFVGFNQYITSYMLETQSVNVNANKLQGYWGFETLGLVFEGQSEGTTVPNPISSTSPVPAGSCVVTGDFPTALTINGDETEDITITLNLSTNKSFEWKDDNQNGLYEPSEGDTVVDMGLRGLFPTYQK